MNTEFIELFGHADFIEGAEGDAGALGAVTEGGVVDGNWCHLNQRKEVVPMALAKGRVQRPWCIIRPSCGKVTRSKRNGLSRLRYALRSPLIIRMIWRLVEGIPMNSDDFRHRSSRWQREVSRLEPKRPLNARVLF